MEFGCKQFTLNQFLISTKQSLRLDKRKIQMA